MPGPKPGPFTPHDLDRIITRLASSLDSLRPHVDALRTLGIPGITAGYSDAIWTAVSNVHSFVGDVASAVDDRDAWLTEEQVKSIPAIPVSEGTIPAKGHKNGEGMTRSTKTRGASKRAR